MTEEKLKQYLTERSLKETSPFKVPDGYFDTLCDSIMNKLPEGKASKKPRLLIMRKRVLQYAAAAFFAVTTISLALYESVDNDETPTTISASITEDIRESYEDENYVNEALDYAMIDNSEIAAYLTGY